MRFLYSCDIHGDKNKYEKLIEVAINENIKYMVWGGDLLPKRGGERKIIQAEFLKGNFLDDYFNRLKENNIVCILIPGNDDLEEFDKNINEYCNRYNNIININKAKYNVEDISFIGLSDVLDNPFRNKNRVLMEDGLKMEKQLSDKIWVEKGTKVISVEEWKIYRETKIPRMKDILNDLPILENNKKTIFVFHDPPYGIGLDECQGNIKVGSKEMANYIEKSNAYMSLHGHIHESPIISGKWYNELGNTLCIQPGQTELGEKKMTYAIIDTDFNTQNRYIEDVL